MTSAALVEPREGEPPLSEPHAGEGQPSEPHAGEGQPSEPHESAPVTRRQQLVELLLVGGATPLCLLVSWLLQVSTPLDMAELAVGFTFFHLAFIINDPHFSVTYLLFYEDFRGRAFGSAFSTGLCVRYWLAGVLVPIGLAVWALSALASGSAARLGLLLDVMFILVGWHYVKQGFGVMMVLSARRGMRFALAERRIILAHCLAGWVFAWANPHKEAGLTMVEGVVYTALPRPYLIEAIALVALVITSILLIGMLVRKVRREGSLPLLAPLTALLSSVWVWMVFANADPLVRYMTPALHSLQYLYFVWLLKRNEACSRMKEPYFEPPPRERLAVLAFFALGLGWLLFHGAPWALDDLFLAATRATLGKSLGPTPCFAAIYAFVNIHHYFMDAVIWRRDNPRTRLLTVDPAPG